MKIEHKNDPAITRAFSFKRFLIEQIYADLCSTPIPSSPPFKRSNNCSKAIHQMQENVSQSNHCQYKFL